ncbi:MAG: hypothetical protein H6597_03135 [Flavobacteriales bacterium]|nr:hypothetical protein [Flavobacteriales bacterium]
MASADLMERNLTAAWRWPFLCWTATCARRSSDLVELQWRDTKARRIDGRQ